MEIYDSTYELTKNDTLLNKDSDKMIIETEVKNKFSFIQKVLSMADRCKIIEPESIKTEVVTKLELMEKQYENI